MPVLCVRFIFYVLLWQFFPLSLSAAIFHVKQGERRQSGTPYLNASSELLKVCSMLSFSLRHSRHIAPRHIIVFLMHFLIIKPCERTGFIFSEALPPHNISSQGDDIFNVKIVFFSYWESWNFMLNTYKSPLRPKSQWLFGTARGEEWKENYKTLECGLMKFQQWLENRSEILVLFILHWLYVRKVKTFKLLCFVPSRKDYWCFPRYRSYLQMDHSRTAASRLSRNLHSKRFSRNKIYTT